MGKNYCVGFRISPNNPSACCRGNPAEHYRRRRARTRPASGVQTKALADSPELKGITLIHSNVFSAGVIKSTHILLVLDLLVQRPSKDQMNVVATWSKEQPTGRPHAYFMTIASRNNTGKLKSFDRRVLWLGKQIPNMHLHISYGYMASEKGKRCLRQNSHRTHHRVVQRQNRRHKIAVQ